MTEKYLFITDTHFHMFTEFSKPDEEYGNDRFREQMEVLQKAIDLAREHDATLVHGGDIFHKRGSVSTEVFNHVFKVFAKNKDVEVILLRGNHDSVNNSLYSDSSIVPFEALDNVRVVDNILRLGGEVSNILFVPYGQESDEMKAHMREPLRGKHEDPFTGTRILFGHFGVNGAVSGTSSYKLGGEFTLEDIHADDYDYILLGHYHKRQMLNGNPNHIYGGALMQQSFSDEGYQPGAHLLTIHEDKTKNTLEFIPIKSRMFTTISGNNIPDNLDEIMENNFVRFIGDAGQAEVFSRLSEENELTNVRVMVDKEYKSEVRLTNISSASTPVEITKAYAEKHFPNSVKEAMECLQEAMID